MAAGEVLVTNMELLAILAGRPHRLAVEGGGTVVVRLPVPEELIASQRAANEAVGGPRLPMTLDKAVELCTPVDIEAVLRGGR